MTGVGPRTLEELRTETVTKSQVLSKTRPAVEASRVPVELCHPLTIEIQNFNIFGLIILHKWHLYVVFRQRTHIF